MEQSMAEGSQSFDEDLARLLKAGLVTRDEALVHSDSPTNLLWRLQNSASSAPANNPVTPNTSEREAMSCMALGFGEWVVVVAISVVICLGC
jgi:twitching motility protein PilU